MKSKIYSIIAISSILTFALIAGAGISTTAFLNVLAQEDAITPEDSVNDTLTERNKGPSSTTTEFSAVNDTMSDQNASQWTTNATLEYAQGKESKDTGGMSEDGNTGMTEGLGNDTSGMTEGQTDPNGEEADLGTGGP